MRPFVALFLYTILASVSLAETSGSLDQCKTLHDDEDRLACFDEAIGYAPLDATKDDRADDVTRESATVGWTLIERTDEFNGANTSRVYLEEVGRTGEYDAAVLSVGCRDDGSYTVVFYKRTFINTSNRVNVRYRFDDLEPISESWYGTTGSNGAILPDGFRDFKRQLKTAEKVVFEATDFQGARHRHTFEGLRKNNDQLSFVMGGCDASD